MSLKDKKNTYWNKFSFADEFKFDFKKVLGPLCIVFKQRILMQCDTFVFTYYKSMQVPMYVPRTTYYIVILVIEYAEILIVFVGTSLPHDFIYSA